MRGRRAGAGAGADAGLTGAGDAVRIVEGKVRGGVHDGVISRAAGNRSRVRKAADHRKWRSAADPRRKQKAAASAAARMAVPFQAVVVRISVHVI
jgi:hypothetical protein